MTELNDIEEALRALDVLFNYACASVKTGKEVDIFAKHNETIRAALTHLAAQNTKKGKFTRGDLVKKKGDKGQWHGRICGDYDTDITPIGYNVESLLEKGSVQIYPEDALEPWDGETK